MDITSLYSDACGQLKASEIGTLLAQTRAGGFISFAAGVPAPELFPAKDIAEAARQVFISQGSQVLQYGDPKGNEALRLKLSERMEKVYGIAAPAENILLTSGSMQCLDLCARLFLQSGDKVLVEAPTFIDAMNTLTFTGAAVEGVPGDEDGIDLTALAAKLEADKTIKMIYVIPDFQNPTGTCWSAERRQAFVELVSQYEVVVLEDNPYGEISYTDSRHFALKSLDQKGQILFLGSLSKTFSPGIRIGWLTGAAEVIESLVLVKEKCDIHSSIPDQAIAAAYMDLFSYEEHIRSMCSVYQKRRDKMAEKLRELLTDFSFLPPEGGFFLWLQLPEKLDCMTFFEAGLATKVAFVPGTPFYPERNNNQYVRLNFTGISEELIGEGVLRMAKAYDNLLR